MSSWSFYIRPAIKLADNTKVIRGLQYRVVKNIKEMDCK